MQSLIFWDRIYQPNLEKALSNVLLSFLGTVSSQGPHGVLSLLPYPVHLRMQDWTTAFSLNPWGLVERVHVAGQELAKRRGLLYTKLQEASGQASSQPVNL